MAYLVQRRGAARWQTVAVAIEPAQAWRHADAMRANPGRGIRLVRPGGATVLMLPPLALPCPAMLDASAEPIRLALPVNPLRIGLLLALLAVAGLVARDGADRLAERRLIAGMPAETVAPLPAVAVAALAPRLLLALAPAEVLTGSDPGAAEPARHAAALPVVVAGLATLRDAGGEEAPAAALSVATQRASPDPLPLIAACREAVQRLARFGSAGEVAGPAPVLAPAGEAVQVSGGDLAFHNLFGRPVAVAYACRLDPADARILSLDVRPRRDG